MVYFSTDTPPQKIRVLVAEDHESLRHALVRLLSRQSDIEVVGEACDGQSAVEMTLDTRPDVVVMDVAMPHCNGIAATRGILEQLPDVKVIALSMYAGQGVAEMMREAGAVAYVPKGKETEALVDVVRRVTSSTPVHALKPPPKFFGQLDK